VAAKKKEGLCRGYVKPYSKGPGREFEGKEGPLHDTFLYSKKCGRVVGTGCEEGKVFRNQIQRPGVGSDQRSNLKEASRSHDLPMFVGALSTNVLEKRPLFRPSQPFHRSRDHNWPSVDTKKEERRLSVQRIFSQERPTGRKKDKPKEQKERREKKREKR